MREVSVEEARKSLGELVTEIANGGGEAIVTKNGIKAAVLTSYIKPGPLKLSGKKSDAPTRLFIDSEELPSGTGYHFALPRLAYDVASPQGWDEKALGPAGFAVNLVVPAGTAKARGWLDGREHEFRFEPLGSEEGGPCLAVRVPLRVTHTTEDGAEYVFGALTESVAVPTWKLIASA